MDNGVKQLREFGPFRVDPEQRLLLRDEQPIALSPKAFDLLLVLLEHSGQVVLKDDLMKTLWPDTFVEESNLGQQIFQLRKALGDRSQGSSYIVTVPGRGYRFAHKVRAISEEESIVLESHSRSRLVIDESWKLGKTLSSAVRRPLNVVIGAAAVAVLTVALSVSYRGGKPRRSVPPSATQASRRSVAVLGFRDLSGRPEDAWLSTALAEMLNTELAAGEKVRLVPGEDVARTKQDLHLPDAESLSKDTLSRLHKSLGTDVVVLGSYTSLGGKSKGSIRVDLRLQDAVAGETVAEMATTGTEDDLFNLVSRAGTQLREKLGLGAVSTAEAVSVKAALPANAEAARLYAEGLARLRVFDALAARDLLQQAVVADPKYPLARAALAATWSALGFDRKAVKEASRAFQLSANLSREDRLLVEGRYRLANHEYEKAINVYRTLFTLFPDNLDYGLRLADAQQLGSKSNDALATVAMLRKLAPPASNDPRIDLQEATDWIWISNSNRAQVPLKRALDESREQGSRLLVALALRQQCRSSFILGHVADAVAACHEARDAYASAGDRAGEAAALRFWADAIRVSEAPGPSRVRECPPEAIDLYRQALDLFRSIGSENGMGGTMNSLGMLYTAQGDLAAGEKMHREALAIYRRIANTASVGVVTANLGDDRMLQGDLPGAMNFYDEALALDREVGDPGAAADVGYSEANIQELRGALSAAKLGFEESLKEWQKEGDQSDSGYALFSLGEVLLAEGDFAGARKAIEQCLAIRKAGEDKVILGETQMELAGLSLEEGRTPSEVETTARNAIEDFKKERAWEDEGLAWALLARALFAEQKFAAAKHAAAEALSLSGKSPQFEIRMGNAIVAARMQALDGSALTNSTARRLVSKQLAFIISEARRRGYFGVELEARLLLCEIEASNDLALSRRHAKSLEDDARSRGFEVIARKAQAIESVAQPLQRHASRRPFAQILSVAKTMSAR
jgi:DNA-binding winged helix-turn-helix (wHTH) protein/tetratricopeptide (TPR) repeat protein